MKITMSFKFSSTVRYHATSVDWGYAIFIGDILILILGRWLPNGEKYNSSKSMISNRMKSRSRRPREWNAGRKANFSGDRQNRGQFSGVARRRGRVPLRRTTCNELKVAVPDRRRGWKRVRSTCAGKQWQARA